ncbi:sensor histidine kinase [Subtercola frigoramans]|uniref:Signal transduction histidine kinase n=1 Tax=Subtercola frigoramans TaxID=120298 RepID=A0ABS2L439_9MICO|nr:ATP-binding protein [Subtercola frigoramans]MBM7471866.1 signal transduction histidine kinase [Subtercola frigoramans]
MIKHQEPLLRTAAWLEGTVFTVSSLACFGLAGDVPPFAVWVAIPAYLLIVLSYFMMNRTGSLVWGAAAALSGLLLSAFLGTIEGSHPSILSAVLLLSGGGIGAMAIILQSSRSGRIVLIVFFLLNLAATLPVMSPDVRTQALTIFIVGWSVNVLVGVWLDDSVRRARTRIARLGTAHQAERRASELEAQRRQSARLLHDTVLATLTLLAHSGVGVDPDALRSQAAEDAVLLRQLRLGETPAPRSSGGYTLQSNEVAEVTDSIRALQQRFQRRGLTVHWHGDGDITLPQPVRSAFLMSLGECLENVRRHSGVDSADVTITQNAAGVRAMVTDTGVGFDMGEVEKGRLGIAESVVARIRDVGGNARIFSAPGAGTTVVLEVPR